MKKNIMFLIIALASCLLFTGCMCKHEWSEATCTAPQTCTLCEKTEGKILPHNWQDATCTSPKTCKDCNLTEGEPLGHAWIDATCEKAKTCSVCKDTSGSALGHQWTEVTYEKPKCCTQCNATTGISIGEKFPDDRLRVEDGAFKFTPDEYIVLLLHEYGGKELSINKVKKGEYSVQFNKKDSGITIFVTEDSKTSLTKTILLNISSEDFKNDSNSQNFTLMNCFASCAADILLSINESLNLINLNNQFPYDDDTILCVGSKNQITYGLLINDKAVTYMITPQD